MIIPDHLEKVRDIKLTEKELITFEEEVKKYYEDAQITAPVHLSKGNEKEVLEIFQYVHPDDWVFSSWRNHFHALLHGLDRDVLMEDIIDGRSMTTNSLKPKFYSSSIVAGIIPIAVGAANALKIKKSSNHVWCFIGDMTFETGIFYEAYKYVKNFDLPLQFVVEDNNLSTNTPTDKTWGGIKREIPDDVIYYSYERGYPHHGTGNWVLF
jgi:TPP-dependent pyruvate/acetoin dehydrogenase alpha subunit